MLNHTLGRNIRIADGLLLFVVSLLNSLFAKSEANKRTTGAGRSHYGDDKPVRAWQVKLCARSSIGESNVLCKNVGQQKSPHLDIGVILCTQKLYKTYQNCKLHP